MSDFKTGIPGIDENTLLCCEKLSVLSEKFGNGKDLSFLGDIKSRSDYFSAADEFRKKVIFDFIEKGVDFQTFDSVVSPFAKIGKGTLIRACCEIDGKCKIGQNCDIGPMTVLSAAEVGSGTALISTKVTESVIGDNVKIGPFAQIRPNCVIKSGVKIGDFVEIKNSTLGRDTHASHLTYIGDSDVGERVNFGCGVVTSNYNGKTKARTTVGDDVFVGCNANLVAPVCLGNDSYIAAGSTITEDVLPNALGIARQKQTNIDGWVERNRDRVKK
ncbi:MAG: hypothetical protein J5922_04655 [Clostridia bacterium]|nr:hypothetical protein [Clostridia bacterium]